MKNTVKNAVITLLQNNKLEVEGKVLFDESANWISVIKKENNNLKETTLILYFDKKGNKLIDFEVHLTENEIVEKNTKKIA